MILKHVKTLLVSALFVMSSGAFCPEVPPVDTKVAAAGQAVAAATSTLKTMTSTITSAGIYVYTDAIALLAPMSDPIANPIWASLKLVPAEVKQTYLDSLVALAAALVDNRERGVPVDIANLRDALDANISSDDFTMALTSPFKSTSQVAVLTAAAKAFAKPITKKQDFKSIIALRLLSLSSAQAVDVSVFGTLADLVARRLDDDEVVKIVAADGSSSDMFEFQIDLTEAQDGSVSSNYFDKTNHIVLPEVEVPFFKKELRYENSWPNIRAAIEKICGSPLYRAYTDGIDVTRQIGKAVNGTSALRTELLGKLIAPITMTEIAGCLDRLSSIDPFGGADLSRFMNRIKMLRTLLSKSLVKSTSDASKMIAQRAQFIIQSKLTPQNAAEAGISVDVCKAEIKALLDAMGSETYNDQIPESGTVVALQWKNPATGLNQYLAATPVKNGTSVTWTFSANCVDYIDDTALFWSLSSADKIGFQCLHQATPATSNSPAIRAPGLMCADSITRVGANGIVGFTPLDNNLLDPTKNIATSVSGLKNNGLTQFFLEGTAASASFKSVSFVPGVSQQSGYLSVGSDGVVRTFNAATKSPSGVFVNNALTAGPWETFTIVPVEQFFIDLAKVRNYADEATRIDFWRDAIKQSAADTAATAKDKRCAITNELLRYIQAKPLRFASLPDAVATKFADTIDFAESMFAGFVLNETELRLMLSKVRAEIEISVDLVGTGANATIAPMPVGLPLDGQTVVIFIPSLAGSSSGRYLEIIQESNDPERPSYVVSATATGPVAPAAQFKVSVFRDSVCFESVAFPGNVIQVGTADANYKNLAQEARAIKLRAFAAPLAKDNRGGTTGFWEDANKAARLELCDDAKGQEFLQSAANKGYLHVDSDGYLRVYDSAKISVAVPSVISTTSAATQIQLIPVKDLYAQLGKLQSSTEDIARVAGYQNLMTHIETPDDIRVLIDEIGGFLNSKRVNQKAWASLDQSVPLKSAVASLLKAMRATFKQALTNKAFDNQLAGVEQKFVVAPVFSSQTLLADGQIVALGWKSDSGVTQYVSVCHTKFGDMKLNGGATINDFAFAVNTTTTQLEVGAKSPIDGFAHFRVLMHPNSNIATLQSLAVQANMQAVPNMELVDIEERYASSEYLSDRPSFDKYKNDVLGVALGGEYFADAVADDRVLEEFMVVVTDGFVSFKSVATGGFLSVNPVNQRLVTIDPATVKKAGMNKAGVMVPTPRESFIIVPVSAYITSLGDIVNEPDLTARLARYLYYVTGGSSPADRKIFLDSIAQEVATITKTKDSWSDYLSPSNADARSSLMAIMNQLYQDKNYQQELRDEIDQVAGQLDAGYTGAGLGGIPAKGSTIVLETMNQDRKYVKIIPSSFNPAVFVLAAGVDGGDDLFDPACQMTTDARTGMLGFKSSLAQNKYVLCSNIDPVAAKSWIMAKRNASTELTLTGTSFGSLGYYDDQLFKLVIVDSVAGTVQLQNVATGGFLSWVTGKAPLPTDATAAANETTSVTTNAVSFSSSTRLRVIDPATLKPFGSTTINAGDAAGSLQGTTFKMTVFDAYYKMLVAAAAAANYPARFDAYSQALPLIKSENELAILLTALRKLVDAARSDKASKAWADFSSEGVQSKFMVLLDLISQNFPDMLVVDGTTTKTQNGKLLEGLRNYESTEAVATYAMRWQVLQNYLDNLLTPTNVPDFMSNLSDFMADRVDAITIIPGTAGTPASGTTPAVAGTPASLKLDVMYTVTTWLAEHVLYNKVLAKVNKRAAISALIESANKPVTYAEYINYIDVRWVSGKDRFTVNEKPYVLKHLQNAASPAWLALASAEDFDLSIAKDLFLRARANQFRDDQDVVVKLNAVVAQLVHQPMNGTTYMSLITDLIKAVRVADSSTPAFTEVRDALLRKAALWKTRVILTGAGQLDLYTFASTLNLLLIDPLMSSKFTAGLTPILQDVAAALAAQGITFSVGSSGDGTTSGSLTSGALAGASVVSGLSI